MSSSLDRRTFLQSAAAAGAALSLGAANRTALAAAEGSKPLFKISLAEWSFHRALKAGSMTNLDFPKVAKQDFDIDCVEYVNVFFMDKAKDHAVPQGPQAALRRPRREERPHHVRRRGRPRRLQRCQAHRRPSRTITNGSRPRSSSAAIRSESTPARPAIRRSSTNTPSTASAA